MPVTVTMNKRRLETMKSTPINSFLRFVLVGKKTLSPAMHCHQDDMENPVEANTLGGLIAIASDWHDTGQNDFLRALCPGGDLADYKIVVEEVTVRDLSGEIFAEFQQRLEDCETEGLTKI